ncbi:hypothetical protein [Caulobacter phage Cr30]|uniref:hypothetical protein n=1 Tax=Caulobacter phage Cr30 TaxID=1357714 RepID=UPI0004A9B871|nr:hypothetical protein OZ74_gp162 [Caulobacter phage Cr30]AGS81047.1 hypothetical protein [Caulobacter phage Cr30]
MKDYSQYSNDPMDLDNRFFNEGYDAELRGDPDRQCPYPSTSDQGKEWYRGYLEANWDREQHRDEY